MSREIEDMSTFPPTTTVFNDGYIAETYEAYRRDQSSVDESWRQFFRTAESIAGLASDARIDERLLRKRYLQIPPEEEGMINSRGARSQGFAALTLGHGKKSQLA